MGKNFVSYNDATVIMGAIGQKFSALNGAYVIRGNSTFDNLPSVLTPAMNGYVYNVSEDFETDARFVEGLQKKYPQGTNVVIVDLSTYGEVTPETGDDPSDKGWYEKVSDKYVITEDTSVDSTKTYYEKDTVVKYDVLAGFIDVDKLNASIKAVQDMITGEFDKAEDYAAGDVVVYENKLYKFKSAYTAYTEVTPDGTEDPSAEEWYEEDGGVYELSQDTTVDSTKTYYQSSNWDENKVEETTVAALIEQAEPASLTAEQTEALLALLD